MLLHYFKVYYCLDCMKLFYCCVHYSLFIVSFRRIVSVSYLFISLYYCYLVQCSVASWSLIQHQFDAWFYPLNVYSVIIIALFMSEWAKNNFTFILPCSPEALTTQGCSAFFRHTLLQLLVPLFIPTISALTAFTFHAHIQKVFKVHAQKCHLHKTFANLS